MTPDQVIAEMKKGNERFRTGKMMPHDYVAQQQSSAAGQYPAAVVLGCIDSRAPGEILFDQGIGEAFNARIAGNVVNDDLLGSMEFGCAVAGAKAVVVFGHTRVRRRQGRDRRRRDGQPDRPARPDQAGDHRDDFRRREVQQECGLRRRRGPDERLW